MKTTIAATMFVGFFAFSNAYTHHMGVCPEVAPVDGFEMEKFLGYWYVVEKTSTGTKCDGYNYTRGEDAGKYVTTQDTDRHILGITSVTYRTHYAGKLSVLDLAIPARMEVRFPLNIAGAASYIVFATDYDNYAGVFICQKFRFTHRRNIAILSRSRELDNVTLNKLHEQLEAFGVDSDPLSSVPQSECDIDDDDVVGINIDANTFTKKNIRKFFSEAANKFRQGAGWIMTATELMNSVSKIWRANPENRDDNDSTTLLSNDPYPGLDQDMFSN